VPCGSLNLFLPIARGSLSDGDYAIYLPFLSFPFLSFPFLSFPFLSSFLFFFSFFFFSFLFFFVFQTGFLCVTLAVLKLAQPTILTLRPNTAFARATGKPVG
jgi:hypothetical protein